MHIRHIFLTFFILNAPYTAIADEILSPLEFGAYTEGKTLYFSQHGRPYGVEQYLPGRKSIWKYSDGTCTRGTWYQEKSLICFVYESDNRPQCWHFMSKPKGFAVRAAGNSSKRADDLEIMGRDTQPISCKGQNTGV